MTSSNKEKKKSVYFISSERNISYPDTLSFEERSKLWCTTEDLAQYERDVLESVDMYRDYLDGKTSFDPNKFCTRGLEAYCDTNIVAKSKVQEYYIDCILDLQDELFEIEEGGPGMDPERREKLINDIDKLDAMEAAKARRRASKDRSAADQIYKEEKRIMNTSLKMMAAKAKIHARVERPSFSSEPLPKIQLAKAA